MKTPVVFLVLAVAVFAAESFSAESPATAAAPAVAQKPATAQQELQAIITKVQTKAGQLGQGPKTERTLRMN